MLEVDATLKEIEYAFDTLKSRWDRALQSSLRATKWLGNPAYKPVLEELKPAQGRRLCASASRELLPARLSVGTFSGGDRSPARHHANRDKPTAEWLICAPSVT